MQNWYRRCSTLAGLALAVSAVIAAPASAQSKTVGLLGGADFTTLTGTDSSVNSSTGFAGGFYVGIPVKSQFSVEAELLYANKGAQAVSDKLTINLNYLEVPVLAKYGFSPDGGAFVYAGPYVGLNVWCNTTTANKDATVGCDAASASPNTVFGGAIGIGFQKSMWGFDLRYEYDFTSAIKDENGKNSAFMVLLRLGIK